MTKILFIMFPGNGVTKEGWDHQYINGKKVKHNFFIMVINKCIPSFFWHTKTRKHYK